MLRHEKSTLTSVSDLLRRGPGIAVVDGAVPDEETAEADIGARRRWRRIVVGPLGIALGGEGADHALVEDPVGVAVGVDREVDFRVDQTELGELQPPEEEREDLELARHRRRLNEGLVAHAGGIGEADILQADGEIREKTKPASRR